MTKPKDIMPRALLPKSTKSAVNGYSIFYERLKIVGIFSTTLIFLPWMEFWTAKSLLLFGRKRIGTSVMGWPPKKILCNLKISPW